MNEQVSPAPSATTSAPAASVATPSTPAAVQVLKFCALDILTANVGVGAGAKAFLTATLANARALGFPVGAVDASKVTSAIGRAMAESRETVGSLTAKGGRSMTAESFDWSALSKAGVITPLQAKIFSAVATIARATDSVRRARNAAK